MADDYTPDIPVGGEGDFTKGATSYAIIGWSGNEEGTRVDITTTKDRDPTRKKTYTRQQGTKTVYRATVNFFADKANAPMTLRVNDIIDNVTLSNSETGYKVTMPKAIVEATPIESGGVGGVSSFRTTVASQGSFDVTIDGAGTDIAPTTP